MSAYKVVKCHVTREAAIIEGLLDMGFTHDQIETYNIPQNLQGYHGDTRAQKAHVIVRRKYVNRVMSSGSSNDIGFEKVDGKYVAHVSAYDRGWWKRKAPRFEQVTAADQVIHKAKKKGYRVKKIEVEGKIKLELIKNF